MIPHRFTSQALTDPRIHWPTTSQVDLTGTHRALPVRCLSPVGGDLTGARCQELTNQWSAEARPNTIDRESGRLMGMSVEINMSDGATVLVRASGGYAPDVMHDLQNRAAALISHTAWLGLQTLKAVNAMNLAELDEAGDPDSEDVPE